MGPGIMGLGCWPASGENHPPASTSAAKNGLASMSISSFFPNTNSETEGASLAARDLKRDVPACASTDRVDTGLGGARRAGVDAGGRGLWAGQLGRMATADHAAARDQLVAGSRAGPRGRDRPFPP